MALLIHTDKREATGQTAKRGDTEPIN